jgi:phage protein U
MFAQLGSTVFDGLKSFVAFSNDEEAILVEHALIGRKPRMQGAGLSLRALSISVFLHQEFCIVKEEIEKLRTSKNTFEVLPLLWGNGQVEGEFVIASMSIGNQQMDTLGNAIAVSVSLSLKESVVENKEEQQQQKSRDNAFAVGNKKPATKSNRVNPTPCNAFVSKQISLIQSNGGLVADLLKGYKVGNTNNTKALTNLANIKKESDNLKQKVSDPSFACIYNNATASTACTNVSTAATSLGNLIAVYEATPVLASSSQVTAYNTTLQAKIGDLKTAVVGNLKGSALRK